MKKFFLENMINGWFVGDFTPSAFSTSSCEVGLKRYVTGQREELHYHKVATEITLIVSGKVKMMDLTYGDGDIVVLEPGTPTDFEALTDVVSVVVKIPGVLGDKYLGSPD
jgi:hypothetical protein